MAKDENKTLEKSGEKSGKEKSGKEKSGKKKRPNRVVKWFRDLRSEFKKVIWPTKKKVFNNTTVVVITMVLSSAFVGALDYGLLKLFSWVLDLKS